MIFLQFSNIFCHELANKLKILDKLLLPQSAEIMKESFEIVTQEDLFT